MAYKSNQDYRKLIEIEFYGFTESDLDKNFHVNLPLWGGLLASKSDWTLREIRSALETAYCNKIGVEYMHIPNREQCNWIRD
jgi:2-oxoglutarate dehydrogenase E1 component